jgi:hypothetical protein
VGDRLDLVIVSPGPELPGVVVDLWIFGCLGILVNRIWWCAGFCGGLPGVDDYRGFWVVWFFDLLYILMYISVF